MTGAIDEIPRIVFVTGTDTGVGKTVVSALLAALLHRSGVKVRPMKVFSSGGREDAVRLRNAVDGRWSLDEINPYAFAAPVTPLLAAREEGREVSLQQCCELVSQAAKTCEVLLLEGAGGLMSPLGPGYDSLDLITRINALPVLVAGNRLGVINQVLMAGEVMRFRGCLPCSIVLTSLVAEEPTRLGNLRLLEELRPDLPFETLDYLGGEEPLGPVVKEGAKILKKTLAAVRGRT